MIFKEIRNFFCPPFSRVLPVSFRWKNHYYVPCNVTNLIFAVSSKRRLFADYINIFLPALLNSKNFAFNLQIRTVSTYVHCNLPLKRKIENGILCTHIRIVHHLYFHWTAEKYRQSKFALIYFVRISSALILKIIFLFVRSKYEINWILLFYSSWKSFSNSKVIFV